MMREKASLTSRLITRRVSATSGASIKSRVTPDTNLLPSKVVPPAKEGCGRTGNNRGAATASFDFPVQNHREEEP